MGEKAIVEFYDGLGGRYYSEEKQQRAIDALNAIDWEESERELRARRDAERAPYNEPFAPDPTVM